MKRIILIDGNNLLFRSYFATAYSGALMKNSKNFPTNAIYGFVNMINKIIAEEKPEYIMCAFDKGKNFRHDKYENYKAGRNETPNDLKVQFPKAYEVLSAMGIRAIDFEPYEADDIIGTFARMAQEDEDVDATIISSDKDLLQLISSDVDVKLLKQHDYIVMDEKSFFDTYQCEPIRMIDLKALMGDASDNIPGVKGIGEKTAISLISKYGSLEGVYEHIDEISGATKTKLVNDKENAFFSKEIATIYKEVPLNMTFDDIKWNGIDKQKLTSVYRDLEFWTMIKKLETSEDMIVSEEKETVETKTIDSNVIYTKEKIDINKDFAFYVELSEDNYHKADILGISIYDGEKCYFLDKEGILNNKDIFKYAKYTYDLKKGIVSLNKLGIDLSKCTYDLMICAYLLNYNVKDDIAYISNNKGYNLEFYDKLVKKGEIIVDIDTFRNKVGEKSIFIYDTFEIFNNELIEEDMSDLFKTIEMPLISVLAKMEMNGFDVDSSIIDEMRDELDAKLQIISAQIYNMAGEEFNIASPKQLGEILFDKMNLPHGKKKGRNGYPTDHDTLVKLYNNHPIIPLILEHRNLSKLMSTYMDSLKSYIMDDNKIHTIYKQAVTRTGRLSSVEPNLQNIPIRDKQGKQIRRAFKPRSGELIMSSDYSQIELRVLAHITKDEALINSFNNNEDIHSRVASDIYGIPMEDITKVQRRNAKAVIFGIVYGISGFGLGENLDMNPNEAKLLIDKYLNMYSGVRNYMSSVVEEAKEKGYTRTLFNRKRVIDELKNTNYMIRKAGERIALNTPIQGTSADIIKMAMIKVDEEMTKKNLKSKMLVQVHDELVFSVPEEELETMKELVRDVMENITKLSVPLKVEIESGTDWYNAK